MVVIRNFTTWDGKHVERMEVAAAVNEEGVDVEIDATGLTLLPALIDSHVHFRTPGAEYKEDWKTGSRAAIYGGVTTVIDMPNNTPSCTTLERLRAKAALVQKQLDECRIPLRHFFYLGGDRNKTDEIPKCKDEIIGIKVFMGSSTGDLLVDDEESLDKIFAIAAQHDILVGVHAEDEHILRERRNSWGCNCDEPRMHSIIRDRSAAAVATERAIRLAEKHKTRLNILHISTKEECDLIREAKKRNLTAIFAETTPHHLLMNTSAYEKWGAKIQVNPPIREESDNVALWAGIADGTIDTIGTDHAPHTLEEKSSKAVPSGLPGVQLLLPLLLNCVNTNKVIGKNPTTNEDIIFTLPMLVNLTRLNTDKVFRLKEGNEDVVLVDMKKVQVVTDAQQQSKCGWSPYTGLELQGWPVYTICQGKVFSVDV